MLDVLFVVSLCIFIVVLIWKTPPPSDRTRRE